jgi:hypothetical protein
MSTYPPPTVSAAGGDRPDAQTLALLVRESGVIVAGEVTRVDLPTPRDPETWAVEISVRETLKGRAGATARAVTLDPLEAVRAGASGVFFLGRRAAAGGRLLLRGDDAALLDGAPGAAELRAHVDRLLAGESPVSLALAALASPAERLRREAAFDLERLGAPAPAARRMLAALRDRTYPEDARATLARAAARVPGAGARLAGVLLDLLEAGVGDAGFRAEAARLLGGRRGPRTVAALRALVEADGALVRAQAVTALGSLGTAEARDLVHTVARTHPDPGTRDVARQVLRQLELAR